MVSSATLTGLRDEAYKLVEEKKAEQPFIDNLPLSGKRVIARFVASNGDDKLHDMATHLKTAILIPSMYLHSTLYYIMFLSSCLSYCG